MEKNDIYKLIQEKLVKARNLITECEKLADEHQTSFSFSVSYGMGGTYYPHPKPKVNAELKAVLEKLSDAELAALGHSRDDFENEDDDWAASNAGWNASSNSC